MIVAPSLVIVTSPIVLTSILSMPRGPSVVRTVSATIFAAVMLFLWASLPVVRPVPSFRIRTGTPPYPCADIQSYLDFEFGIRQDGRKRQCLRFTRQELQQCLERLVQRSTLLPTNR